MSEGIEGRVNPIPDEFALVQNYPNPFNPVTAIWYALPEDQFVELTVYNMKGQVVDELVVGWQPAGYHETRFLGSHLASGIYICSLKAGDFNSHIKMLLVK
ncbi:MAG: T9SS type A sorting domain-containing protein [bacterium]